VDLSRLAEIICRFFELAADAGQAIVQPGVSKLVFDPEMDDEFYRQMSEISKLQNWISLIMQRDSEKYRNSKL
jgi:hypothetical protein